MAGVKTKKISYLGWLNCISISNEDVELIVTTDVGPRILYFGYKNAFNHMKVFEDQAGRQGDDEWMIYGGHRLWHSPEAKPRTYEMENTPCLYEINDGITLKNPTNIVSGMEKEIRISMKSKGSKVQIDHKIINRNAWDIEFSLWALTVAAPGGRLVIPQPTQGPELLPNRNITFWTYTRLNDPRVHWLDRYIFLDQDPRAQYTDEPANRQFDNVPFKIGLHVPDGWVAYINNNEAFVKYFEMVKGAVYPDFGHCSFEAYTNKDMLEIESLTPLTKTGPGEEINHKEVWELFSNIERPENDDQADDMAAKLGLNPSPLAL